MSERRSYAAQIVWTGDRGAGTSTYRGYDRTWEVRTEGKPVIRCSNDALLGGDATKPNPEEMLIASLSACHMLWYLHLACNAGVVVRRYADSPVGLGEMEPSGAGRFIQATLRPHIQVAAGSDLGVAARLHDEIHRYCFIARSVNFPILCEATYEQL